MTRLFQDPELKFDNTADFIEVEKRVIMQGLTNYNEGPYRAVHCMCNNRVCHDWHVTNVADMQGVRFTEDQAKAVAGLLNLMHRAKA